MKPATPTRPPHYHLRTDNMDGLGTWKTLDGAARHAHDCGEGYTAHQLAGGFRVEECTCWMGAYLIDRWAERGINHD